MIRAVSSDSALLAYLGGVLEQNVRGIRPRVMVDPDLQRLGWADKVVLELLTTGDSLLETSVAHTRCGQSSMLTKDQ